MDFAQILSSYKGHVVEVFQTNTFMEGKLLSVNEGYSVVRVSNPSYTTPPVDTTVLHSSIQFVRVLSAV